MESKPLGRSGLSVPPICLGGNVFGWTLDEAASLALLDRAFEAGLTFIDTAASYSDWVPGNTGGESETIIGRWLKQSGKRDSVIVATKLKGRLRRDDIRRAAEASLRRLGIERIDLYYTHYDDPETPQEETLAGYAELIGEGKVGAIGVSNISAARLREALDLSGRSGLPRYEALQPHYNLVVRDKYEGELETVAADAGLAVLPYFALASGFLSGKYRSEADLGKSARGSGMEALLNPRGLAILSALDEVAAAHDAKPAEVALAWLIARPSVTAPIASATNAGQIESLARAAALKLTPDEIGRLAAAGDAGA